MSVFQHPTAMQLAVDALSDDKLRLLIEERNLTSPSQATAPQFYVTPLDREFVDHEEIIVNCGMSDDDPNKIAAVSALAPKFAVESYKRPTKWYLFDAKLPIDVEDPVANAVRILAPLLLAAEKAHLDASAKKASVTFQGTVG